MTLPSKKAGLRILVLVVSPVVGTIAYFLSGALLPANSGYDIAIGILVTVTSHIGLTSYMIEQSFEKVRDEILKTKDDFKREISEGVKVTKIEPADQRRKLTGSFSQCDKVKNTFVNLHSIYSSDSRSRDTASSLYREFIARSGSNQWVDITTYQDYYSGTFRNVDGIGQLGKHIIYFCESRIDAINFTLLEESGNLKEVYFGWVKDAKDHLEVYHSRDRNLLKMFAEHFRRLTVSSLECAEVNSKTRKPKISLRTDMFLGKWISITPLQDAFTAEDYKYYSIISVGLNNGRIEVNIDIHSVSANSPHSRISSNALYFSGEFIIFEGSRLTFQDMTTTKTAGIITPNPASKDRISGRYYYGTNSHSLFGARLDEHKSDISFSAVAPVINQLLSERRH